jgi:tetratricopeptide (TPR) repeat protein
MRPFALALGLAAGLLGCSAPPGRPPLAAGDLRKSGTIHFPVTCKEEVRADFDTAVALLHSFFYDEARRRFLEIAERDPACAMAWWGVAMTWYHPLWAPPTPDDMKKGSEAVAKAKQIGARTEIEAGFIDAVDAFFNNEDRPASAEPVAQSCHGPRILSARAVCFRQSMERLHGKHPENLEVTAFTTLSLLGTAPPTDKLYTNQLAATAILEPLFEKYPEHPGVAHYIIHAYDYPSLANRALEAARRYGEIAPWVPHALHMPSHIYTRLGMWADSIASNLACVAAAREYASRFHGGAANPDELHALDYLMFAFLQTGRESRAKEIVDQVARIERFFPEKDFAMAYAAGAIRARWTLERRRWTEAADLELWHADLVKAFPFAEAHVEFARAVGGARAGRVDVARRSLARMEELREALKEPKFQWWINQIEIQRLAAAGWLAHAEKKEAEAEKLLRESADLEDKSGTHPVTPGQILPAREQLGDLLLELGRPADALTEYESSLRAFPNRFNGHFGAARAAEKAGKADIARTHYGHLLEMTKDGDSSREELKLARDFLASRKG